MSKKLNEKTASINLEGFRSRLPAQETATKKTLVDGQPVVTTSINEAKKTTSKAFTGAGIFMSAITGKDELSKEVVELESKLNKSLQIAKKFEGADLVKLLDTRQIRRSQWANRNSAEFNSKEFLALRSEMRIAGGNTQPIKVRRLVNVVDGQPEAFEIVYGHRRFQACVEEGLQVNAVIVEHMTDIELFEAMERENRGRKNLSAWEQGVMYNEALKHGLYPSARKLEEALNLNHSDCSRALQLAKLPLAVVHAFASPLDLQVRWAKKLTDTLQKDPDGMLAVAKEIAANRNGLTPLEIFNRLVGIHKTDTGCEQEILINGRKIAVFKLGHSGRAVIEFEAGALKQESHKSLLDAIKKVLAK